MKKSFLQTCLLVAACYCCSATVTAAKPISIFDVFYREDVLEVRLEANFSKLLAGKSEEYHSAKLTYNDATGTAVSWDIDIRQRGNYRRRVCDMPPFKLRFSKEDLLAKGLQPYHTLKLVTHCLNEDETAKDNLLKEYLAYKLFNQLTDKSYRVQLVQITYVDTEKSFPKTKRYGFLIESTDEVADRLKGEECECMNFNTELMNRDQLSLVHVFQYMIGNADYNLMMLRNLKLITPTDGSAAIVVPYDFDFAGLVDAPYAVPNPDYKLKNVKERVFLGNCSNRAQIAQTLEIFRQKKQQLLDKVQNFKLLNKAARTEMTDYLESFFTAISTDALGEELIFQACKE